MEQTNQLTLTDEHISNSSINILYIDDEPVYLVAFKASFRRKFNIYTAESIAEAKEILAKEEIHIILSDCRMPVQNGIDFFESIMHIYPNPVRMLITAYSNLGDVIEAINRAEVYKYFVKPWDTKEMESEIEKGFETFVKRKAENEMAKRLEKENSNFEFFIRQRILS